jgi:hypothetical protein
MLELGRELFVKVWGWQDGEGLRGRFISMNPSPAFFYWVTSSQWV